MKTVQLITYHKQVGTEELLSLVAPEAYIQNERLLINCAKTKPDCVKVIKVIKEVIYDVGSS